MKTKSVLFGVATLICLLVSLFGLGNSEAAGTSSAITPDCQFPILVPTGSYMSTCSKCSWQSNLSIYSCTCEGSAAQPARIDLATCPGYPTNYVTLTNKQGSLVCGS